MYIQCHSIWNEIGDSVRYGSRNISEEGLDQNLPQSMGWLSQMVGTKSRAQGMRNADGRHPLGEVRLHGDNFGETSE